jgi:cytochrome P450
MALATQRRAATPAVSPPTHPLWGHLMDFARSPLGFLSDCARNYGPVVPLRMLHLPAVLLRDPTDIERVLVTEHDQFIKPAWLRTAAVKRLLGKGLIISEGPEWRRQRHVCQSAFHLSRMGQYGHAILDLVEQTLQDWEAGQTRLLQRDMSRLTLEVIARTLFAADTPGWTSDASEAIDTLMARFGAGISFFGMMPLPPGIAEIRAVSKLNRIADTLIAANLAAANGRSSEGGATDLLTQLRRPAASGGEGLTGQALRDQVKTFLGAGYESSALTLTWAFLLLARHAAVEAELVRELNCVVGDRAPAPADLQRLPYTQAVVKETLRLFPPLWMTGRQAARQCELGGVKVSAGALVMTSQWAVQRLPQYFISPDEFRPERWLNGETQDLPRHAFFPFGGGPRVCIGQSFAMMESVLILAAIARCFRLIPPPDLELRPSVTMTLRPPAGIQVRLTRRR